MRKLKLLFAACALLLGAGQTWAQTDVTSTYLTNPSFEVDGLMSANNNTDPKLISPTGWTQEQNTPGSYQDNKICDANTSNGSNYGTLVTPSDETYYLFYRHGWNGSNYAKFTSTAATLPAGAYTLSVDYKMVSGSDNTSNNNNTSITLSAISGENTLGTITAKDAVQVNNNGTTAVLTNNDWKTLTTTFTLEEETSAQFVINLLACGPKRSDFVVDNVRLLYEAIVRPTAVSIDETLTLDLGGTATLTPTYTPSDANTDTEITWTTNAATVATVANGVVTAVGPGNAIITATTANGKVATCTVTVNDVTAAAAPSFFATSIESGTDYFLYNAATGKFLGTMKEGWGTQAALTEHGIPFTVTLADGKYTLDSHTYNNADAHFLNDGWVDGASTSYNITSLGEGKFSISIEDGSVFLSANKANTIVGNSALSANSVLAQWYFVSKEDLESAFATATNASPVDATFYIGDPDFSRNHIIQLLQNGQTTQNPGHETYPWEYTVSNYHFKGGVNGNMCAETYQNGGGKIYQILNNVRNGKYVLKCQGFHNGSNASYLYANDEKVELAVLNANGENTAASMDGASNAFTAGQYNNELTVYVTDGTLTIGIDNASSNWACFDNFELYYCGPTIGGEAEELPETAMTADKWYYFDVPVDGDYDFTVTTLNDIVYTTDGTILIENESTVTDHFSGTSEVPLTAGRYYVKSASAQILAVAAHSFTYELGDATLSVVDGGYTQSQTFTVTFPDATTNDPDGVAALVASSTATVNGSEVALTAVEGGFSLDLGTLTPSTDYAIVIPAGVYGYGSGEMYNEAISLTVHTPLVFDGVYCLLDAANKLFLGRGAAWGTEAVVDKYGIPFNLVTDATGVSSIEFVDWTGVYLFKTNDNGMFTDGSSTGWQFVKVVDNVYTLKTATGDLYAKVDDGTYGKYVHAVEGETNATAWTLVTKAQRDEVIAAYPKENLVNVVTAAGLLSAAQAYMTANHVTDIVAAGTAYVAANFNEIDCTSFIRTATFNGSVGDWAWNQVRGQMGQPAYGANFAEVWCATGSYTQTIDKANLPAGIYKLTVQGYERRKDNNAATALYNAGYNLVSTYLAANGEQVRFTDWNEVAGKPTNTGAAVTAFDNGAAVNTVFVYLDGNTDLTITVKKPNYIWDCWAIFNNFTLTRYEQTEVTMKISNAQYATFIAPFDVEIPSGVKAYTVNDVESDELSMTEVNTTISANTPVVLYSDSEIDESFKGKNNATQETYTDGLLTGVYADTPAPVGSYVLQNQDKVAFYKVFVNEQPTVGANRCYLTVSSSSGARAFYFPESATGISALKALNSGEAEIYNAAGARVPTLQKGMNIIKTRNGQTTKVMVK